MSFLWAATAAFVLIASLCCRVLIVTRYRKSVYAPEWLAPALLALMFIAGGLVLVATQDAGG
jgi:hypothetical protein